MENHNLPDNEEHFALATLRKQKECLLQWMRYLNVKKIYMPQELRKYQMKIVQINDAIKILEAELLPQSEFLEKNLMIKSNKHARPANRKTHQTTSKKKLPICDTNVTHQENPKRITYSMSKFTDNKMTK